MILEGLEDEVYQKFPPQKMGNERCNIQTGSLKTVAAETENTI